MTTLLEVEQLQTSYGSSQVLFGMYMQIGAGEVATLLGRNGKPGAPSFALRTGVGAIK